MKYRIEKDTLGEVEVPADVYYGPQTQRSVNNFKIATDISRMPEEVIEEASEIVGSEYINADKYLQDIVRDKRYWETKRQNIRKREKQMEETISKYETEIQELEKSRKEILRKAKEFGVDVGSPAILEWANRH